MVKYLPTPNIIANVHHSSLYKCAVRAMQKKLKLSADDGDTGSKKCKQGLEVPMIGSGKICVSQESGVRRSVLC
jgi:hypothetical protein